MDLTDKDQDPEAQTMQDVPSALDQELQKDLEVLVQSFIKAYKMNDPWTLTDKVQEIRKTLTKGHICLVPHFMETGALVYIIKIFNKRFYQRTRLLMECSWIMINIAADETGALDEIVKLGIIPKLIPFLKHPDFEVRRNVVWALENIAMGSREYRDLMIKEGIVKVLDYMLSSFSPRKKIIANVASLISELTRRPYPDPNITRPLVKYLGYFLQNFNTKEITTDTLKSFSNFSDGSEYEIQRVLDVKPVSMLLKLLKTTNDLHIRTYALRTIGNLLTGDDAQTTVLITNGVVPVLAELLENSHKAISREACWALSNIMAGSHTQINEVFRHKEGEIIRKLINMIQTKEIEIAKECLYCICNACLSGDFQQAAQLVREDVIRVLIDLINVEDTDAKLIILCVESIRGILDNFEDRMYLEDMNKSYVIKKISECNGIKVIEKLQNHVDERVYDTVARLIDRHLEYSAVQEF